MGTQKMHADEADIAVTLVRQLLASRFPRNAMFIPDKDERWLADGA